MKKILSLLLALTMVISLMPTVFAESLTENLYAECVYDTYHENNQGRIKKYDDTSTILAGSVFDRYAEIRFNISAFSGVEFGGAVLGINARNNYEGTSINYYGSLDGTYKTAYALTSYKPNKGKAVCEVAVTDYIKEAVSRGDKEVVFFIKASSPVLTIFSSEDTTYGINPSLYICKEEPYIQGQIAFEYPTPSQETIKADLSKAIAKGHPYLFATKEDFDMVRENAFGKNPYLTKMYKETKDSANYYFNKEVESVDIVNAGGGYNGRADTCLNTIAYCAFIYAVEGDEAYAERAWKEAEAFANLDSWGHYQYIDNNKPAEALAICYDWMYDWLSDAQKEKIVGALRKNHLDTIYDLLENPNASKYQPSFYRFYFSSNNHALLDNTGTFMSALAIADTDPDYASFIMHGTFKNMKAVVENWYPDSAWYESLGYWQYTGKYMARWLVSLEKGLGTSYGLNDLRCMQGIVEYPLYGASSNYVFILNDTPYEMSRVTDLAYVLATIKGDPALEKYTIENTDCNSPWDCLAFNVDVDYDKVNASSFAYDKIFRNTDMVTMRNSWSTDQELFCGLFVQDASLTHGVMNSGTIALEAFGDQWITNSGRDNYDLPGYWDAGSQNGQRWTYYFARAEANSCLVIDPSQDGGQKVSSGDIINKFKSSDLGAYAITDLTKTYADTAESYKRGVELINNRSTFAVQDEVKLYKEEEVYSFYNINKCEAEISEDGKSVILTKGNKKVKANIICDKDYELSIMSSDPIPTSPQLDDNRVIRDIKRIAVHFPSVKEFNLRVEFTPYLSDSELKDAPTEIVPMDSWTVSDGEYYEIAATNLLCDGKQVEGFDPETRFYEVKTLPSKLELVADASKYDVSYESAEDGRAKIAVLTEKATGRKTSYMLELPDPDKQPNIVDVSALTEIGINSVSASSHDGNAPENTIDGKRETRWSAFGRQTLTLELEKESTVNWIAIAFYSGNVRYTYFDMQVSEDGKNWTTVSVNESCGVSDDFEYFDLGGVKAKYVRYKGYGANTESWNSITEVKVFGK